MSGGLVSVLWKINTEMVDYPAERLKNEKAWLTEQLFSPLMWFL